MARMALTSGSCPSCGRAVARTVSSHGLAVEAYHCPVHGRRTAADHAATVADWVAAPPTMVTLGQMLDSVAPPLGGVDWLL